MFDQFKTPLSSLTIQGGVVAFIMSLLSMLGINIAPDLVPQLNAIITGVAAIIVIYGRFRARTIVTVNPPSNTS